MPEEIRHPDGRIEHPSVRHEASDVNARWVVGIIIGSIGFAAVAFYVLFAFLYEYRQYQDRIKRSPFPLAPAPSTSLPPEPRHEQLDRAAGVITSSRAAKEEILQSYGLTEEEGYVHIPIAQAMKLMDKKLPARAAPPADQQKRANGLVDAGEPNSGRVFRRRP